MLEILWFESTETRSASCVGAIWSGYTFTMWYL